MDYDKKYVRHRSLCLECGNVIRYGRTDKKYCCEDCKTKHHNDMARTGRAYKHKVISIINRNYGILDGLLKSGTESADLIELMSMGFVPGMATSYRKEGKHDVYTCFDIRYIMTRTRLYSIMKIRNLSLSLQVGMDSENQ